MNSLVEQDWISGGYALVKVQATAEALRAGILGDRTISASSTIVDMLDLSEMWRMSDRARDKRVATVLEQIGLQAPSHSELADWAEKQVVPGGHPCYAYFPQVADLRRFWQSVTTAEEIDFRLIGLAILRDEAAAFLEDVGQQAADDIADIVRLVRRPEPGGTLLGYEPLGAQPGGMYSWLTCYFHKIAADELGIRPNGYGLLSSLDEARRVCDLMNSDDGRADDAHWSPWAVFDYPLAEDVNVSTPTQRSLVGDLDSTAST